MYSGYLLESVQAGFVGTVTGDLSADCKTPVTVLLVTRVGAVVQSMLLYVGSARIRGVWTLVRLCEDSGWDDVSEMTQQPRLDARLS